MNPASKALILAAALVCLLCGCSDFRARCTNIYSPDVKIISYHLKKHYQAVRSLAERLYARNPRYEPDLKSRKEKIRAAFGEKSPYSIPYQLQIMLSHELLRTAFSPKPPIGDRVLILILGLKRGIDEAYDTGRGPFLTGCQIDAKRLERLYSNISQTNWRLKTYKGPDGKPLFLTNQPSPDGYVNMGFEVIMTQMLTRIQDDIYLRGGLEGNLTFRLSTVFLSIL